MQAAVVDASTDRAFAGNPAAVVLLPAQGTPPPPGWMQQVAAEFALSETAFLRPTGGSRYELRWFTPTVEVGPRHALVLACAVLGQARPPFGDDRPAYVLERELMIAALQGDRWVAPAALRLGRRTAGANLPLSHRVVLAGWSLLLVPPLPRVRAGLVAGPRDPSRRPALLRWLVSRLRRSQR